jgi:hypothetical protein
VYSFPSTRPRLCCFFNATGDRRETSERQRALRVGREWIGMPKNNPPGTGHSTMPPFSPRFLIY